MGDLSKSYFQNVWGDSGYHEHFNYGMGIGHVVEKCIIPFISEHKKVLEVGSGGGAFTEILISKCNHLTAIDVIKKPEYFETFKNFTYHELPDKSFDCGPVKHRSIDFVFCYGVFCHLSNEAIKLYLKSIYNVLKKGGDFVFMISNFRHTKHYTINPDNYALGDFLPVGHFYQDDRTIDIVVGKEWSIINRDMIHEHRDIIIHLKKK